MPQATASAAEDAIQDLSTRLGEVHQVSSTALRHPRQPAQERSHS